MFSLETCKRHEGEERFLITRGSASAISDCDLGFRATQQ